MQEARPATRAGGLDGLHEVEVGEVAVDTHAYAIESVGLLHESRAGLPMKHERALRDRFQLLAGEHPRRAVELDRQPGAPFALFRVAERRGEHNCQANGEREHEESSACDGRHKKTILAGRARFYVWLSTDRMLPAGSLNHAMFGPMSRAMPFSSWSNPS